MAAVARVFAGATAGALALSLAACPASRTPDDRCASLDKSACARARGLAAAATTYSELGRDWLLDLRGGPADGRALALASGAWQTLPETCAERIDPARPPKIDPRALDASFVAFAFDGAIVAADADLRALLADGRAHRLRLLAMAIARDLDPPFFRGNSSIRDVASGCACGRATHFVGAEKYGGILAYETEVRADRTHAARPLDAMQSALASPRDRVTEVRLGGLEIDGLDAFLAGAHAPRPLAFRLKDAVPVAHAVYPIADACPLALPAPDVSPIPLTFGDATYGTEVRRPLHVVNRAPVPVHAILGDRTFAIPARAAVDLPLAWTPSGDAPGCETQTREEMLVFYPQDREVPVSPKLQTVHVVEQIRTGPPRIARGEHIDTTANTKKPTYALASRDWSCPADFAVSACRVEHGESFAVTAAQVGNGCHFGCVGAHTGGPAGATGASGASGARSSAKICRFDAIMECQLRCGP